MDRFQREIKLIGQKKFKKLQNSRVLVVGVGGVGSYVSEILARSGIGHLTLVDYNKVDITNINRQIIALTSTVGQYKVDVLKNRLLDINPNIDVVCIKEQINCDNVEKITNNNFDYVVDAIDQTQDKIELICSCNKANINIVSSMGAGNRIEIPQYVVCDLYETQNDGLAKKLRKRLRKRDVKHLNVVYCSTKCLSTEQGVGSISYHPSVCGIIIASFVINEIIKGE